MWSVCQAKNQPPSDLLTPTICKDFQIIHPWLSRAGARGELKNLKFNRQSRLMIYIWPDSFFQKCSWIRKLLLLLPVDEACPQLAREQRGGRSKIMFSIRGGEAQRSSRFFAQYFTNKQENRQILSGIVTVKVLENTLQTNKKTYKYFQG